MLIIKFCWFNVCLLRLAALLKNASRKGQTVYVLQLKKSTNSVWAKILLAALSCQDTRTGKWHFKLMKFSWKKCPVSCYIVMCMQDLNVNLFSLYSLALKDRYFLDYLNLINDKNHSKHVKGTFCIHIIIVILTNILDFHVFFLKDCTALILIMRNNVRVDGLCNKFASDKENKPWMDQSLSSTILHQGEE